MDPITFITIVGVVISIIAGTVQVLDYLEKRREKKQAIREAKKSQRTQKSSGTVLYPGDTEVAMPTVQPTLAVKRHQDWGEAVDVSVFYGRTEELNTLDQWIVNERCRLVALLGMGGIGKTTLSIKLAQQIQDEFEYVIWRSIRNAPPLQEILADIIKFLSNQQETDLPETVGGRISRALDYLRSKRCLIVLDNAESILQGGDHAGEYREGYEDYGELIRRVGGTSHQSCLVLTSREKPKEVASSEGETPAVRSLQLTGLKAVEGEEIFKVKG